MKNLDLIQKRSPYRPLGFVDPEAPISLRLIRLIQVPRFSTSSRVATSRQLPCAWRGLQIGKVLLVQIAVPRPTAGSGKVEHHRQGGRRGRFNPRAVSVLVAKGCAQKRGVRQISRNRLRRQIGGRTRLGGEAGRSSKARSEGSSGPSHDAAREYGIQRHASGAIVESLIASAGWRQATSRSRLP